MNPEETKTCSTCKFWQPKYHGVGRCSREGFAGAKHWVTEGKDLLTVASFSCSEHAVVDPINRDTV